MEETLTRRIKIYCPQHQSTFEIAESPKIVCEIKEHALSNDFPNGEFWEYCCDCQTFFPSSLEVGGKAKEVCLQCERKTIRRFVCDECKIVTYDSGEDTKGKIFHLNADTEAVAPSCPGCRKDFSGVTSHLHKCEEAQMILLTPRKNCPFCKKEIAPAKKKKTPVQNPSDRKTIKLGTSAAKTKLLGSICPSCGTGNEPDSVFCANCGQSLKPTPSKQPSVLPPNMPPIPTQVVNTSAIGANVKPTAAATSSNTKGCLAAVGVLFGVILLCAVIQGIINSKNSTTSTTNYNYNTSSSPYKSNNSYTTNTMNTANKPSSNSSLSSSFSRDYTGTIGGQYLSMSLTRNGNSLKGTASTSRTDTLYGTIDNSGNFNLKAYENDGSYQSGTFKGRISNGSISGTWTNPQGGQGTSFSLTED